MPSGEAKAWSGTSHASAGMVSVNRWSGQPSPTSRAPVSQVDERAVVVALAPAEAGTRAVDGDQRNEDEIGLDRRVAACPAG